MATFIEIRGEMDKAQALLSVARGSAEHGAMTSVFRLSPNDFSAIPGAPFAFWAGSKVRTAFQTLPPFELAERQQAARCGLGTLDDFRFLRGWWELPYRATWPGLARGGRSSRHYQVFNTCIRWHEIGRELKTFVEMRVGSASRKIQSEDFYFREGLSWPLRGVFFTAHAVPAGCIFSVAGKMAFTPVDILLPALGLFNSRVFDALLRVSAGRVVGVQYESGLIGRVPTAPLHGEGALELGLCAARSWSLKRHLDTVTETSHAFYLPALAQSVGPDLTTRSAEWSAQVTWTQSELLRIQAEIDDIAFRLYGIDGEDRARIEAESGTTPPVALVGEDVDLSEPLAEPEAREEADDDEDDDTSAADASTLTTELLSWCMGVAFGRFDLRLATGERPAPSEPGPFDPLPARSPGMCADDALAAEVLVDDEGHPDDLVSRITGVFTAIFPDPEAHLDEAARLVGAPDLRIWLRRSFFPFHLKRYSKSRRKAPIWWPLSTSSGSYTVWVAWPRLTRDTLFRLVSDFVTPKLNLEIRRLTSLKQESGLTPTRAQAVALAGQEDFVAELTGLRDELAMIAPLWNPVHDDGVVLHAALLWRVFRDAGWQKECRERWDGLIAAKYDWAHIAMHLWPERVVPKCRVDRSLAIAHGLESLFWVEDGGKWRLREDEESEARRLVALLTDPYLLRQFEKLRAYASTHGATAGWWAELRDGRHDDEPVALALWPERVMRKCQADSRLAERHGMPTLYRRAFTDPVKKGKMTWADELLVRFPDEMARLTAAFDEATRLLADATEWSGFWTGLDAGTFDSFALAKLVRPAEVVAAARADLAFAEKHAIADRFWIDGRKRIAPDDEATNAMASRASAAIKSSLRAFMQAPAPVRSGRGKG